MKHSFLILALLALGGCYDAAQPAKPAPISFRQFQPIYLNVGSIEMVEEYRSPGVAPNVEHDMHLTPADAMQIWTKQRLKATGGTRRMQVVLKDASVMQKDLPTKKGITGVFTVEPDKQYDARLEVELRIYGDAALSEASVNVIATRMLTMSENLSLAERQQKYRGLLNDLMANMNAELEKNIAQYFVSYVNYSMNP